MFSHSGVHISQNAHKPEFGRPLSSEETDLLSANGLLYSDTYILMQISWSAIVRNSWENVLKRD